MDDIRFDGSQALRQTGPRKRVKAIPLVEHRHGDVVIGQKLPVRTATGQSDDMRLELVPRQSGRKKRQLPFGSGTIKGRDDVGDSEQVGSSSKMSPEGRSQQQPYLGGKFAPSANPVNYWSEWRCERSERRHRYGGCFTSLKRTCFKGIDLFLAMNKT